MKLKNSNKLAAVALAAASMLGVSSCNYLDVVPPEQAGLADAMKDHDHAKGFLYSCYAQTFHRDILPRDYRSVINSSTDEYLITETWYANEGAPAYAVLRNTQTTTAPAGYDPAFWNTFYAGIGQTLLFDQKLTTEGDANEVCNSADERTEWLAESRFCRAFYHFSLLRLYGPIPLTKELASMDTDLDQYPGRSHFDACVDWIAGEFDAAAADLPLRRTESSEMGRADQVVCKALKARLLLYAASDLWNGKFPSAYSGWRNNNYETPGYGKELVSRQFNPEKWQRALAPPAGKPRGRMRMDEMDRYRELIKENIDYDLLLTEYPYDEETLEGYVELMAEVCCSRRDCIRIAGDEVAAGVVKSRFLKLNHEHISYVLDSLSRNTTLIKNIKAYTLAALYNAPTTISQYYASLVSHDLAQDAAEI